MALTKEEIYSGGVRYYDNAKSISEVAGVHTADEVASLTSLCIRDSKLITTAGVSVFKNLEELDLGNNKLIQTAELETLSNLKDLNLSENKLSAVTGLADLPIEQLDLSTNPIESLANIDAPASVVGLKMHSCHLTSLEGLARFTELDSLGIYENRITSLAIDPVPSLRSLLMKSNPMQRSAGLDAFPGVTHLVLGDDIRVLEGLEHLPNLKKIEVTGPIEEITPASLEVLVALKLSGGKVSLYGSNDLYDRYPALKIPPKQDASRGHLKYRGEPLTIRGLVDLYTNEERQGITTMTLSACSVTETDGLDAFPSLTILDLAKNKVESVVGISGMTQLDTLTLEDNAITSVANIEANTSVDEMSLQKNLLESLEGLAGFSKLRKLDATRNPTLKNAHPGQPLPALEHLELSATGLETIEGLAEAFPNLRHLDIDRTEVTNIVGLDGFEHLNHVVMSDKIETIDEGSLAKIVAMRAKGERARIGWSDPAALVAKYPALAGE